MQFAREMTGLIEIDSDRAYEHVFSAATPWTASRWLDGMAEQTPATVLVANLPALSHQLRVEWLRLITEIDAVR